MNLNPLVETLLSSLKEAIFSPKDQFERAKRHATRTLIAPLIFFIGGESALVALLGAVSSLEFRSGEIFFRLAGSASDSFLVLSGVVLLSFGSVVGSNLFYAGYLKKSQAEVEALEANIRTIAAYQGLKARFEDLVTAKRIEEAQAVAGLIYRRYANHADRDPDFVQLLASDASLAAFRRLEYVVPDLHTLPAATHNPSVAAPNPGPQPDVTAGAVPRG